MNLGKILGSISPAFGLASGDGLFGQMRPMLGQLGGMGLGGILGMLLGGGGAGGEEEGGGQPAAPAPNDAMQQNSMAIANMGPGPASGGNPSMAPAQGGGGGPLMPDYMSGINDALARNAALGQQQQAMPRGRFLGGAQTFGQSPLGKFLGGLF